MAALSIARDERGFTLIEVMVAILILVVGFAGAFAMIDGANARTRDTKQREAATALSREVIEAARSVPYNQLNPTSMVTQIQAVPGLEDSSAATGWTVERRNHTFTITTSVCSIDDNQDKFGNLTAGPFCDGTGGTADGDANPDDYKRVTVTVTWMRGDIETTVQQAALVNNEASAVGPAVDFTNQDPGGLGITEITCCVDTPSIKFNVDAEDGAAAIRFAVDGAVKDQVNTDTALFTWNINTADEQVPDGTYVVSVTAFDEEGTPGPTRSRTLRLNRLVPSAPQDVFGGWNPRTGFAVKDIVDIQWARNIEPDVTGYRVYRKINAGADQLVCDHTLETDATDCQDLSPPATFSTLHYYIVAYDRDPFTGNPRPGDRSALNVVRVTTEPNQPPELNAAVDGQDVLLSWSDAPPPSPLYTGSNIIFYRVYRGGTGLENRIGHTSQDVMRSFRVSGAAGNGNLYWVAAVDENFSESAPLGPVSEP